MQPKVAVLKTTDIHKSVHNALDLIQGFNDVDSGDTIVIKPNVCRCVDPQGHVNTDPRVLRSVIRYAKQYSPKVIVGETTSSKGTAPYRMMYSGTIDLINDEGATFLDFSNDVQVEITHYGITDKISKTAMEADLFVNVPKIKTHDDTVISCAAKNMFGVLSRGDKWKNIHLKKVLDSYVIFSALTIPKQVILVDGIYCMEGIGPIGGDKIQRDLILAGTDIVSVDTVVCELMCVNPLEVFHLKEISQNGIGTLELDKIHVIGDPLDSLRHKFVSAEEAPPLDPVIYRDDHPRWASAMKNAREKYGENWKTVV